MTSQELSAFELAIKMYETNNEEKPIGMFLLSKLVEQNSCKALNYLANLFFEEQKYDDAIKLYTRSSEQNNSEAEYKLAHIYYRGLGCEKNINKSYEYINKLYKKDHLDGKYILSYYKKNGYGCDKDEKKSFELCQELVEKNHLYATYTLGMFYKNGVGCEKDYKKAFELLSKASEKNVCESHPNLGELYYNGYGCEVDKDKAYELLKKSVNHKRPNNEEYTICSNKRFKI